MQKQSWLLLMLLPLLPAAADISLGQCYSLPPTGPRGTTCFDCLSRYSEDRLAKYCFAYPASGTCTTEAGRVGYVRQLRDSLVPYCPTDKATTPAGSFDESSSVAVETLGKSDAVSTVAMPKTSTTTTETSGAASSVSIATETLSPSTTSHSTSANQGTTPPIENPNEANATVAIATSPSATATNAAAVAEEASMIFEETETVIRTIRRLWPRGKRPGMKNPAIPCPKA